jgi:hypothetical protein
VLQSAGSLSLGNGARLITFGLGIKLILPSVWSLEIYNNTFNGMSSCAGFAEGSRPLTFKNILFCSRKNLPAKFS